MSLQCWPLTEHELTSNILIVAALMGMESTMGFYEFVTLTFIKLEVKQNCIISNISRSSAKVSYITRKAKHATQWYKLK